MSMSESLRSLQSFLLSFTLIMGITTGLAQAQKPFEKSWYDLGYTSIEKALTACERLFQRDIVLPTRVPPMVFTHQFGRCYHDTDENGANNEFSAEYVHEKRSGVRYSITVRPAKFGMKLIQKRIKHVYTLQNQAKAILYRIRDDVPLYILILEKDGWQYRLMLDDGGLNQASSDILLGIANTIQ